jgi:hypothetical protein
MQLRLLSMLWVLVASFFWLSCSDYEISKIPPDPAPDITVEPLEIDYGVLFSGHETGTADLTVQNVGNDDLNIGSVTLVAGDQTFDIDTSFDTVLAPSETTEITISYIPLTFSENIDVIRINSNDPDEPAVDIPVRGQGDAPIISIDPDYYSFSDVYVGCEDYALINISNLGNIDLEISDIEHFASLPSDFELNDYEPYYGMLPLVIMPGETVALEILYEPLDGFEDTSFLKIYSNDPMTPIAYADQDGNGDFEKWHSDRFDQDETMDVDILFVIDNSGSMGGNQTNFKSNFASFISVFSSAGVSYQIAFITTDSSDFVDGAIVTAADPDPVSTVNNIVDSIGTRGSATEKGLWYSYLATSSGPAAPGGTFLRDDARFVVIYVSDEKDWSSSHGMSTTDYVTHLRSLKSSSSLVVAHAVSGDYPGGCTANGGAEFGDGYYNVVTGLGGTFLSICASDWGMSMDTLARESIMRSNFVLTEKAVDGTISVEVDGVESTDWYFEDSTNSVIFTLIPPEGSEITMTYAVWSCQEEE